MNKPNRSKFAYYAKSSSFNLENNDQQNSSTSIANQSMYQAIMGQMDSEHSSYFTKISQRKSKEKDRQTKQELFKSMKVSTPDQTKSYAEIMNSAKSQKQISFKKFDSQSKLRQGTNLFLCKSNDATPTNEHPNKKNTPPHNPSKVFNLHIRKQKQNNSFLASLESYLNILINNKEFQKKNNANEISEKSKNNGKLFARLETMDQKNKELTQQIEKMQKENEILRKSEKKIKEKMKVKMGQIVGYAKQLSEQLSAERRKRKKMQKMMREFQEKWIEIFPEQTKNRKNRKNKNIIEDLMQSENSLDQDEDESQNSDSSLGIRLNIKSYRLHSGVASKQSRLTGLSSSKRHPKYDSFNDPSSDENS